MTISISILGQSALGAALAPNGALATGLAGGEGLSQEPDFASLLDGSERSHPVPVPAEAFDALGMFGRYAAAQNGAQTSDDPDSGNPVAGGQGPTAPAALSQSLLAALMEPRIGSANPASVPASSLSGAAVPEVIGAESEQALAALTPAVRGAIPPEEPEGGSDASAVVLPKEAASPRPQPVSAAVLIDNGALQVIVRSSEAGFDQAADLRNRIEDLAREFDFSLDGVRLNGVALPPAVSGAAHGRRTN